LVQFYDDEFFLQEYLPILNKYKAMPEDYMKYSIDKHLKRWETALTHIAR
jgi:elongator complex protein 1